MKFIRQYAEKINGIEIYPIIGLLIFVIFFIAMLVYVKKMSNSSIDEMKNLPLDLAEENKPNNA
ncbi:MAG: CcoQ/FixQ family Cbb3-type cytochrome c oxidase assembly chaperone [Chitinophagaceae bacterium]